MRQRVKFCTPYVSGGSLIGGLAILTLGLVLGYVVFPNAIYSGIRKFTRLENGTEQWDRFVEIPFPLSFKVYIFHVTNPEQIINGSKPIVQEVGPYIYDQRRRKRQLSIDEENDRVSFYQDQFFSFNNESSGSEDDLVTVLSLPYMGILQMTELIPADTGLDVEAALDGMFEGGLFPEVRVKDLLFDGLKICDPGKTSLIGKVLCLAMTLMNVKNMRYLEDGSMLYSLFDYRRDGDDGYYTIHGGLIEAEDLGWILEWNGMTYIPGFWGDEENDCNRVEGYDSTLYPPFNDDESTFQIFSTDIYRNVPIYYHSDITYKGIKGKRYGVLDTAFWDDFPEESCFCTNKTKDMNAENRCFLDGVIDVYSVFSVPTLLSLPHYLFADEKYKNSVEGLSPSEELHYTYVDLEPFTGTPLTGGKKIQISMVLRPVAYGNDVFNITRNMIGSALPVFWMDEGMMLPDEYVQYLNDHYFNILRTLVGVQWALIALSAVVMLVSAVFVFYSFRETKSKV